MHAREAALTSVSRSVSMAMLHGDHFSRGLHHSAPAGDIPLEKTQEFRFLHGKKHHRFRGAATNTHTHFTQDSNCCTPFLMVCHEFYYIVLLTLSLRLTHALRVPVNSFS